MIVKTVTVESVSIEGKSDRVKIIAKYAIIGIVFFKKEYTIPVYAESFVPIDMLKI